MMTMSAADFLAEWFESDQLKAPMAVSGIIGTYLGVRSPGTAYVLLHHYMGEIDGAFRAWGFAKGGTGQISDSIAASSAIAHGAEIRTEAPPSPKCSSRTAAPPASCSKRRRDPRQARSSPASSPASPSSTWSATQHLPDPFVAAVARYRLRGSSGKVNLALDRLPDFTCRPGDGPHLRGDISIAPSIDYLERAYDDAKYGAFSRQALHERRHSRR
jgi:phytoene dehydrogenase-like protein